MSEEDPLHECLSLTEYIKICREYLEDCFDLNKEINATRLVSNIEAALEILDDMDNAEWIDTSNIQGEE